MGDRATIRIKQQYNDTAIHFYTHWNGSQVEEILAKALLDADAAGRITDEAYCTRIIFDALTQLEGGSTGYGIIIGDECRPFDIGHDSPSVEWEVRKHSTDSSEPRVQYMTLDDEFTGLSAWRDWAQRILRNDLTAV